MEKKSKKPVKTAKTKTKTTVKKTVAKVVAPAVPVVRAPETEASKIWKEIKDKEIFMFALPAQLVSHYCQPVTVEPSKLYLLTTATSVLPSLENALGRQYVVEVIDKYTVVSRAPTSIFSR